VKPLTGRLIAAVRPQTVLAIAVASAFVLSAISTADAGRRSKKGRKARAQERAEKQARRQKSRPPAPAPDAATADGASDAPAATPPPAGGKAPGGKAPRGEKVFDFSGLELAGSVRMPQLLYFLDRAEEELERASLERRSFVPAMMRSLDEESL
jgi:hypothetical protein